MQSYIEENNVPRNKLLSQGYRSVGDWHSTSKVEEGQDERGGRWAGKEKTECGLHKDYFKMQAQAKLEGIQILFRSVFGGTNAFFRDSRCCVGIDKQSIRFVQLEGFGL